MKKLVLRSRREIKKNLLSRLKTKLKLPKKPLKRK